jgi:hypothetical protein
MKPSKYTYRSGEQDTGLGFVLSIDREQFENRTECGVEHIVGATAYVDSGDPSLIRVRLNLRRPGAQ